MATILQIRQATDYGRWGRMQHTSLAAFLEAQQSITSDKENQQSQCISSFYQDIRYVAGFRVGGGMVTRLTPKPTKIVGIGLTGFNIWRTFHLY